MNLLDIASLSKEQLAGIGAALAAVGAAAFNAWRQKQKPDASEAEKNGYGTTFRLHHADRVRVDDLGEKISELTRAIKGHGDNIEDHAEAIRRKAPRGPH